MASNYNGRLKPAQAVVDGLMRAGLDSGNRRGLGNVPVLRVDVVGRFAGSPFLAGETVGANPGGPGCQPC